MAGFWGKWFPALFSNPEEENFQRKMLLNGLLRRSDQEVKRQDGFIKQYLQQATIAKRTGDAVNYAQVKKMLAYTFATRKNYQRLLHAIQLTTTMANQMEAYRDFCGAVNAISSSMGNALSVSDIAKTQKNLERGIQSVKSSEALMDQLLSSFNSSFEELAPSAEVPAGLKDDELDAIIRTMAESKDSLTEDRITAVLNGAAG